MRMTKTRTNKQRKPREKPMEETTRNKAAKRKEFVNNLS
jgi:hypothetical protein